jgi:hypothetical protein
MKAISGLTFGFLAIVNELLELGYLVQRQIEKIPTNSI